LQECRQPWIVHPTVPYDAAGTLATGPSGYVEYDQRAALRTSAALSKAVSSEQIVGSIIGFSLLYVLLLAVWAFVLNDKIQKGPPEQGELGKAHEGFITAASGQKHLVEG
jgi:cytochrome bd ubiquinol oxidase subunit I